MCVWEDRGAEEAERNPWEWHHRPYYSRLNTRMPLDKTGGKMHWDCRRPLKNHNQVTLIRIKNRQQSWTRSQRQKPRGTCQMFWEIQVHQEVHESKWMKRANISAAKTRLVAFCCLVCADRTTYHYQKSSGGLQKYLMAPKLMWYFRKKKKW